MTTATISRAPRISMTKLAEYMDSSATRRRQIIHDQKWPSDYIVPTYTEAQEIISGYVRRRASSPDTIENEINRLLRVTPTSSWHERRIALCIEALKAFMNIAPSLNLANYSL